VDPGQQCRFGPANVARLEAIPLGGIDVDLGLQRGFLDRELGDRS
jgi:hypothetical protein